MCLNESKDVLQWPHILEIHSANVFKRIIPSLSGSCPEIPEIALFFRGHLLVMSQKADICSTILDHLKFVPFLTQAKFHCEISPIYSSRLRWPFLKQIAVLSFMEMNDSIQWRSAEATTHKQLIKRELVSHVMSSKCLEGVSVKAWVLKPWR